MGKGNSTETQVSLKINGEQATNTIKDLEGSVRTLSRELKQLPVDSQAFTDKAKELGTAQNRLEGVRQSAKDVREQMRGMGDDSKRARADLLSMSPVGNMLNNLSQGWQAMRTAIATNVAEMGFLKLAIASTGIGALIIALIALYQYFTKSDEGAKKLDAAMRAIGFITKSVIKLFIDLGEKIVWAFENPKKAISELVDVVLQNVINRFKAVAVIIDGIINLDTKKIADGFIQAGTGVENATDKMVKFGKEAAAAIGKAVDDGQRLAKLYDDIDEAESKLLVTNAKLEAQVSQLLLQSKDRTKSEVERLEALDKASALEKQRLMESIGLQKMRVEAAQLEFEQAKKNDQGKDEAFRKLSEQEAAMSNLRKESIDLQEKIATRRNALLDQEANAHKVMSDLQKKQLAEAETTELEHQRRLTDLRISMMAEGFEKERAILENELVTKLEDLHRSDKLTQETEEALRAQNDQKLEELKLAKAEQDQAEFEELTTLEAERILKMADTTLEAQMRAEDAAYNLKRTALQNRLKLQHDAGKTETVEYQKTVTGLEILDSDYNKKRVENQKKSADLKKGIQAAEGAAAMEGLQFVIDLLGQDAEARKKHGDIIKALSMANIVVKGIEEVQEIWAQAAKLPFPADVIVGGIKTAISVTRSAIAVKNVARQQFRDGGTFSPRGGQMNFGQPHSRGGIQLFDGQNGTHYGEVERGEVLAVFTQKAYENNRPIIDSLLDAGTYSGRPVRNGSRFEDGGLINTGSGSSGSQSPEQARAEQLGIMNLQLLQSINEKLSRPVRAEVVYEQQSKLNADAQSIERRANAA